MFTLSGIMNTSEQLLEGIMQGSLVNRVLEASKGPSPEVGMGATVTMWSDRHAYTIVAVRRSEGRPTEVDVQPDIATRIDNLGMSDAQKYSYEPNSEAPVTTWRVDSKGRYRKLYRDSETGNMRMASAKGGEGLVIGIRDHHYDYSF